MARTHSIEWHTPAPLWDRTLDDFGGAPERFKAPALLRFAGDSFMEDLQEQLARDPQGLADYLASAESWRTERAGWTAARTGTGREPIKLYQPVHNRFYLIAVSLVCRIPGLPDRTVDAVVSESTFFVIRRLVPKPGATLDPANEATFDEYGWFGDRQSGTFELIADRRQVADREEPLPLFPVGFNMEQRPRRLHAGVIPVASREVYEDGARRSVAKSAAAEIAGDPLDHPKVAELLEGVVLGLQGLTDFPDAPPGEEAVFDAQARETLVVLLLDLVEFLEMELPAVFTALTTGPGDLSGPARDLYDYFAATDIDGIRAHELLANVIDNRVAIAAGPIDHTLASAVFGALPDQSGVETAAANLLGARMLVTKARVALGDPRASEFRDLVKAWTARIEAWDVGIDDAEARADLLMILLELGEYLERELGNVWQALLAGSSGGLSGADRDLYLVFETRLGGGLGWREAVVDTAQHRTNVVAGALDGRLAVVREAVRKAEIEAAPALLAGPLSAAVSASIAARGPLPPAPPVADDAAAEAVYVARCVYRRPQCRGFEPEVVSLPSRPFHLASFFDPDAPVRRLQIRMPTDTSVGGLRKFPKSVSIALSKQLREQMARAQNAGLEGLTDQELGSASFNLGVICTFSIPIITICALILLMIIVQLLNIIFWWLPFFRICLPAGPRQ